MHKRFFRLFAAALLSSASLCMAAVPADDTDNFQAKTDFAVKVVNLGSISRDTTGIDVKFPFANTGNAPLVLTYVHASCGCIRLSYPRKPIAPGDSAVISATFHPASVSSKDFKRNIVVKSNATDSPERLFIVGKIRELE